MTPLQKIHHSIIADPENNFFTERNWQPIYTAHESAQVMIIGQTPGLRAQESGIPWNDASGENLRRWLGVDTETFYDERQFAFMPMDFYFPGSSGQGDKPPRPTFAQTWHPEIRRELPHIKVTILIGQYAQKHYLGAAAKENLTETVKHSSTYLPEFLPLVHPSPRNNIWQKKNPWFQNEVVPTLQNIISKTLDSS